jgi:hypothetical protein
MGYKTGQLVFILTYGSDTYKDTEVFDNWSYALFRAKCLYFLSTEESKFLKRWHILPLCDKENTVIQLEATRISTEVL